MEAKDTVIKDFTKLLDTYNHIDMAAMAQGVDRPSIEEMLSDLASEQAELSFKAGYAKAYPESISRADKGVRTMKSILFRTDILKAKLAVIESQGEAVTRRVMPQFTLPCESGKPYLSGGYLSVIPNIKTFAGWAWITDKKGHRIKPPYQPGEVVYLREARRVLDVDTRTLRQPMHRVKVEYKLDCEKRWVEMPATIAYTIPDNWHSPLHLAEKTARHFLTVTDVRPERLQEITEEDAIKEGCRFLHPYPDYPAKETFHTLWDTLYPEYPWSSNSWVWRIALKKE